MRNLLLIALFLSSLCFLAAENDRGILHNDNGKNIFALSSNTISDTSDLAAINVRLVLDEAEAVLIILEKKKNSLPITKSDWDKLFSSEGYTRLKKREASMKRSFEDSSFIAFVLSEETVAAASSLAATLTAWKKIDVNAAAKRALNYLPEGAFIKAKIYPVIKPKSNSFVFEVNTDPAIFLYLNPAVTHEKFENTLAHELHHIGYGTCCPGALIETDVDKLPQPSQYVINWTGAFGEGFAMLAAAGSPDIHPHAFSPLDERERWNNDMKNFNADLKKVESFFLDVLHEKLKSEDEINEAGFSFFGKQGPWYTVGWKMSAIIEKTYGKETLINSMCDMRKLLRVYNQAAEKYNRTADEHLALWAEEITNIAE